MTNLHQLTETKAQLNKTNVNNRKSNNLAGSYQRDTRVTERLWQIGFSKQLSLDLFPEGGNVCHTIYIIRKVMPNRRVRSGDQGDLAWCCRSNY